MESGCASTQSGASGKRLVEGAIYSLGLTPYQYTARRVDAGEVVWLLIPEFEGVPLICGPVLYVDPQNRLALKEGITQQTTSDLQFTGRYKP